MKQTDCAGQLIQKQIEIERLESNIRVLKLELKDPNLPRIQFLTSKLDELKREVLVLAGCQFYKAGPIIQKQILIEQIKIELKTLQSELNPNSTRIEALALQLKEIKKDIFLLAVQQFREEFDGSFHQEGEEEINKITECYRIDKHGTIYFH
jgi:chromosome segregation ATPase